MTERIFMSPPLWGRAKQAEYFFGIKRDQLNKMVIDGRVTAKQEDKCVYYKFADIENAIGKMPDYNKKGND